MHMQVGSLCSSGLLQGLRVVIGLLSIGNIVIKEIKLLGVPVALQDAIGSLCICA
jgi:hypothetical protein